MKFEKKSLIFDYVITYQTRQLRTDWQEGILLMEDFTLTKNIYQNGPIFFSVESELNERHFGRFTYYLPINEEVILGENPHYGFLKQFRLKDALVLRQADQEVDFHVAYEKLKQYAKEQKISLENKFYCVLLNVYGDYIIDLYVPVIKAGEQHDF